ncbi:hypothetical protein C8R45DRAFT_1158615 [Mycena sanguinolenta]|nr:hypothetical protein C8R45DRAFT_1158615 [Mycena sanguinolenta]
MTSLITAHTNKPGYYGKGALEVAPPTYDEGHVPPRHLRGRACHFPVHGHRHHLRHQYYALTHGTRNAPGWRNVLAVYKEEKEVTKVDGKEIKEKKKRKYFELSGYKWMSYVELREAVGEVGRVLVDLGAGTEDVGNIYAATR